MWVTTKKIVLVVEGATVEAEMRPPLKPLQSRIRSLGRQTSAMLSAKNQDISLSTS